MTTGASDTFQAGIAAPSLAECGKLDDAGQLGQLRQHMLRRQLVHAQRHDRVRARRRAAHRHEAAPKVLSVVRHHFHRAHHMLVAAYIQAP